MTNAFVDISPNDSECTILGLNLSIMVPKLTSTEQLLDSVNRLLEIPLLKSSSESVSTDQLSELLNQVCKIAQNFNRTRLLIAGSYLDEHVTTSSLAALANGLDVYLLCDVLICKDQKFEQVFLQRLLQAGAVPTTLGQCLFHWALASKNIAKRTAIIELSDELMSIIC